MDTHQETTLVSWEAPEYVYVHNSNDWYWLVGGIAVALIVVGILSKNYLMSFLILVAGILVMRYATAEPKTIPVSISEVGITIDGYMYPFEKIVGFWLIRNRHDQKKLLIATDPDTRADIAAPIADDIELTELRELLLNFIPEIEISESPIQQIVDRIGF